MILSSPVLSLNHLSHSYAEAGGSAQLTVLRDVTLDLNAGEVAALVAPSGTGKSTLLHLAGLLEKPTSGDILIHGEQANSANDRKRTLWRRDHIGFIYQFHYLLPEFTALENVAMPQIAAGKTQKLAETRARDLLTRVGLSERLNHRPAQLSGGEQQRVAIARALANQPSILLADEPTGNLDTETAAVVFELIRDLAHADGVAALIVTHNQDLAKLCDRILTLHDGQII